VIRVPFLGSLNIRHLLNNLGALSERYLDCGSHKGGSFCSAVYDNYNLKWGVAIDWFLSDETEGETAEYQFLTNALKFMPRTMELRLLRKEHFKVDLNVLPKPFDFYLFDGSHDYESQKMALTYYLPALADEFILCVDDYSWPEVSSGTQDGIKEAGLEILFERELITNGSHDNESFWNGFYVALLKKK
jgi:methyltransferase family protein